MDPKLALISQKQQKQVDDDEAHIRSGKGMGSCEEEGGEGDEDDLGPHLDPPGRQLSTSFNTQSRCQVGVGHHKLIH